MAKNRVTATPSGRPLYLDPQGNFLQRRRFGSHYNSSSDLNSQFKSMEDANDTF